MTGKLRPQNCLQDAMHSHLDIALASCAVIVHVYTRTVDYYEFAGS